MRDHVSLLLALVGWLVCPAVVVHALLYPDQAGTIDWHHSWLGPVSHAVWSSPSYPASPFLLLASEEKRTFGAVDRSGTLAWRQVLPRGSKLKQIALGNHQVVTLHDTSQETLLQSWDASNGTLLWEHAFPISQEATKSRSDAVKPSLVLSETAVFLLCRSSLTVVNALSGNQLWAADATPGTTFTHLHHIGTSLFVVSHSADGYAVQEFRAASGSPNANVVPLGKLSSLVMMEHYIFGISPGIVSIFDIPSMKETDRWTLDAAQVVLSDGMVVAWTETSASFASVDLKTGKLAPIHTESSFGKKSIINAAVRNKRGYLLVKEGAESVQLATVDLVDKVVSKKHTLASHPESVSVQRSWFNPNSEEFLIVLGDRSVLFFPSVSAMQPAWTREEALADVKHIEFVDLPEKLLLRPHHTIDEKKLILAKYVERWVDHIKRLKVLLLELYSFRLFSSSAASTSTAAFDPNLVADMFGVKKLIVVSTVAGKVFALRTDNGRIVWSRHFPLASVDSLHLVRSVTVKVPPVIALTTVDAKETSTTIHRLNALTGGYLNETRNIADDRAMFPFPSQKTIHLHVRGPRLQTEIVAVVDPESMELHFFPSPPAALGATFFNLGGRVGDTYIAGYSIAQVKGGQWKAVLNWNVMFPKGEVIVGVADKLSHEKTASLGRVLGDRSVLYKYLNPNMMTLATANLEKSRIVVYILDAVSGRILHQVQHSKAAIVGDKDLPSFQRMPVHIVQCENWLVYHYWSKQARDRQTGSFEILPEVNVLELYEHALPDHRAERPAQSSFDNVTPHVLSDAFIFHAGITAMGVTNTRSGITTRELLFATDDGQIKAVNRMILDARRPHKLASAMTAEEKEEMLIPYHPYIDENPKEILSYYLEVRNVTNIKTSPTTFESTTLIFAAGLDTFFTRKTPSKTFDILGPEFSRASLLMLMGGLVVGILVARELAAKKKLEQAWK